MPLIERDGGLFRNGVYLGPAPGNKARWPLTSPSRVLDASVRVEPNRDLVQTIRASARIAVALQRRRARLDAAIRAAMAWHREHPEREPFVVGWRRWTDAAPSLDRYRIHEADVVGGKPYLSIGGYPRPDVEPSPEEDALFQRLLNASHGVRTWTHLHEAVDGLVRAMLESLVPPDQVTRVRVPQAPPAYRDLLVVRDRNHVLVFPVPQRRLVYAPPVFKVSFP